MRSKIIPLEKSIGLECSVLGYGHFTTIHPGHIRYLSHAKKQGKKFVVALKGDGSDSKKARYRFNQEERAIALSMLNIADEIVLLKDNELSKAIEILNPSILILGKEFEDTKEKEVVKSIQKLKLKSIPIMFHAGDVQYSSQDLLTISERDLTTKRRDEFRRACKRENILSADLLKSIEAWQSSNLIVLGDTIVDQYVACKALGMSAEAPVVVVKELKKKIFIGGASIVASHIRSLGAKCKLISVVGNDKTANFVQKELNERGITNGLVTDNSRPTTFKKRYVVENQKLFRVTRLEDHNLDSETENKLIAQLKDSAKYANGIVISDFVYGVITEKVIKVIYDLAEKYNLMLFGDVQCSSQIGEITKFKMFSLLCPNEREARIALHDKDSGLEKLSQKLIEKTKTEKLVMKLGSEGFITYEKSFNGTIISQAYPALCANPLDVAGAGDSLLAVMATGLASNENMVKTSLLACIMASLAVQKMGNTPISKNELISSIDELF